jgi:hypothetical protein
MLHPMTSFCSKKNVASTQAVIQLGLQGVYYILMINSKMHAFHVN